MQLVKVSSLMDDVLKDIDEVFNQVAEMENLLADTMKHEFWEEEKKYVLKMQLPEFEEKDIAVAVDEGYLTIVASKTESQIDQESFSNKEYTCQFFVGDVDETKMETSFEEETLTVTVPKKTKKKARTW